MALVVAARLMVSADNILKMNRAHAPYGDANGIKNTGFESERFHQKVVKMTGEIRFLCVVVCLVCVLLRRFISILRKSAERWARQPQIGE